MAQIFQGTAGMATLMGYWYHYAIMFEALVYFETVDTGTRVARYVSAGTDGQDTQAVWQ